MDDKIRKASHEKCCPYVNVETGTFLFGILHFVTGVAYMTSLVLVTLFYNYLVWYYDDYKMEAVDDNMNGGSDLGVFFIETVTFYSLEKYFKDILWVFGINMSFNLAWLTIWPVILYPVQLCYGILKKIPCFISNFYWYCELLWSLGLSALGGDMILLVMQQSKIITFLTASQAVCLIYVGIIMLVLLFAYYLCLRMVAAAHVKMARKMHHKIARMETALDDLKACVQYTCTLL